FDAAARPGATDADDCILDHVVGIEHVTSGRLVIDRIELAAKLGQYSHTQILILENDSSISPFHPPAGQAVNQALGIGWPAASSTRIEERRIGIRWIELVGRNDERHLVDPRL